MPRESRDATRASRHCTRSCAVPRDCPWDARGVVPFLIEQRGGELRVKEEGAGGAAVPPERARTPSLSAEPGSVLLLWEQAERRSA